MEHVEGVWSNASIEKSHCDGAAIAHVTLVTVTFRDRDRCLGSLCGAAEGFLEDVEANSRFSAPEFTHFTLHYYWIHSAVLLD